MGISEWSYSNDYNPAKRQKMKHVDLVERFEQLNIEVELGFTAEQTAREVRALPQLRHRRPSSPTSAASSATPASTSARCTA